MRPRGKPCGALGNTFDAKSYGAQRRAVCKSVLLCSTGLWKAGAHALPHCKQQSDTEQHKGDRTRLGAATAAATVSVSGPIPTLFASPLWVTSLVYPPVIRVTERNALSAASPALSTRRACVASKRR